MLTHRLTSTTALHPQWSLLHSKLNVQVDHLWAMSYEWSGNTVTCLPVCIDDSIFYFCWRASTAPVAAPTERWWRIGLQGSPPCITVAESPPMYTIAFHRGKKFYRDELFTHHVYYLKTKDDNSRITSNACQNIQRFVVVFYLWNEEKKYSPLKQIPPRFPRWTANSKRPFAFLSANFFSSSGKSCRRNVLKTPVRSCTQKSFQEGSC